MKYQGKFAASVSALIAAVIVVTAFTKEPLRLWLLAGVFALWITYNAVAALKGRNRNPKKSGKSKRPRGIRYTYYRVIRKGKRHLKEGGEQVLLRHVNYRISAYLKSAYPDAAWDWLTKHPERIAAEGGTGRIRLYNADEYTHADVTLDTRANITCDLLRIAPLQTQDGEPNERPEHPTDPAVWYDIRARELLENLVAELDSRGLYRLKILENGDICVIFGDREIVEDSFGGIPPRESWNKLAEVIEENEFSATVTNDGIFVSWR
jgi:hypothetical protein